MLLDEKGARKEAEKYTIGEIDRDAVALALLRVQAETLEWAHEVSCDVDVRDAAGEARAALKRLEGVSDV